MKVLFLTSAFPSNDYPNSNLHNFRSFRNLRNASVDIDLIHLRSWKPFRSFFRKDVFQELHYTTFSFPFYNFSNLFIRGISLVIYKRIFYFHYLFRVYKKYDVIHSCGVSMESVVGSYLSKKIDIPHIAQCMGGDLNVILPLVFDRFGWKGFDRYVNVFVCNSLALKKKIDFLYPSSMSKTIYRGVNLLEFEFSALKKNFLENNKKIVYLFLGGFEGFDSKLRYNYKGGVTLLKSWALFIKNLNVQKLNYGCELCFGGPNVTYDLVKYFLDDWPENYFIKVIGQINSDEVKSYLKNCNVVIIPSLFEGLPNLGLEALAVGRPLIASNVGGLPEFVFPEFNGFLYCSSSVNELAHFLELYFFNPHLICEHGDNGRNLVESSFDSQIFVKKIIDLYNSLLIYENSSR